MKRCQQHLWDWWYGPDLVRHVACVRCGYGDCCPTHRANAPTEETA